MFGELVRLGLRMEADGVSFRWLVVPMTFVLLHLWGEISDVIGTSEAFCISVVYTQLCSVVYNLVECFLSNIFALPGSLDLLV